MLKNLIQTMALVGLIFSAFATQAQNAFQKNDHIFTGSLNAEFIQVNNESRTQVGAGLDWQYFISDKWSLGIGIQLGRTIIALPYYDGTVTRNSDVIAPMLKANRFYSINEKWAFALSHQLLYAQDNRLNMQAYLLSPTLYYKFKPHWLVSANVNLAGISRVSSSGLGSNTIYSLFLNPSLGNSLPGVSFSYIF